MLVPEPPPEPARTVAKEAEETEVEGGEVAEEVGAPSGPPKKGELAPSSEGSDVLSCVSAADTVAED
eukprot:4597856-Pyramimonas_sp.AAC.1